MASGVGDRHHATKGGAVHDWAYDSKGVTERRHVVGPLCDVPRVVRTALTSPIASMVQVHDLGDVGQCGEGGLIERMVYSRPSVQKKERRQLTHLIAMRPQRGAVHVEVEVHTVYEYAQSDDLRRCPL